MSSSIFAKKQEEKMVQQNQKKSPRGLLLAIQRLLRSADNILSSSKVLYNKHSFQESVSKAEKTALKESLEKLIREKSELEKIKILLGYKSPEVMQKIKEQKGKIQRESEQVLESLASRCEAELRPILLEKENIENELKHIKEVYLQKKYSLLAKKKELLQRKKNIQEQTKIKRKATKNARHKALKQIQDTSKDTFSPLLFERAKKAISSMKTDINRTKGNLMVIFPSAKDSQKISDILQGRLQENVSYSVDSDTLHSPHNEIMPLLPEEREYSLSKNEELPSNDQ
jgi:predicted Rossmann fold nucleotide-binding protein DprA/Smf involved in DNA uptake